MKLIELSSMNVTVRISAQFTTRSAQLVGGKRCLINPSRRLNLFLITSPPTMSSFLFFCIISSDARTWPMSFSSSSSEEASIFFFNWRSKNSLVHQEKVLNNFLKCQKFLQMEKPFSSQTTMYFGSDYSFYMTFSLQFLWKRIKVKI